MPLQSFCSTDIAGAFHNARRIRPAVEEKINDRQIGDELRALVVCRMREPKPAMLYPLPSHRNLVHIVPRSFIGEIFPRADCLAHRNEHVGLVPRYLILPAVNDMLAQIEPCHDLRHEPHIQPNQINRSFDNEGQHRVIHFKIWPVLINLFDDAQMLLAPALVRDHGVCDRLAHAFLYRDSQVCRRIVDRTNAIARVPGAIDELQVRTEHKSIAVRDLREEKNARQVDWRVTTEYHLLASTTHDVILFDWSGYMDLRTSTRGNIFSMSKTSGIFGLRQNPLPSNVPGQVSNAGMTEKNLPFGFSASKIV